MKLEVGKLYRTRHGKKAIILKRKYGNSDFVLVSFIFGSDPGYYFYYKEDGTYETDGDFTLVGEWEEKLEDKQEPIAPLKSHVHIRENDIGMTVRLRNGAVRLITGVLEPFGDNEFNFTIGADTYRRRDGRYSIHNETPKDVIEIHGFPGERK